MATAPNKTVRKSTAAPVAGGKKSASATATKGAKAAAGDEDPEAAAAAEAEAAEAQRQQELLDLKGRLSDTIHSLKEGDKKSAEQARLDWVGIGRMLNEGRALFTRTGEKGNQTDEKGFGKWLVENGFDLLGQRPTRAGAAWLANVHDMKPGLYALFPTESVDGEPLRRSPRTLQAWVREQIYSVFQTAWERDADNIEVVADMDGDKKAKKDAAKSVMGNVYEALRGFTESAKADAAAAQAKMTAAKTPNDRKAATDEFMAASARLDACVQRKEIMDQHNEDEMLSYFINWRPKVQAVPFKDTSADEAAAKLFALLSQHKQPGEVYDALGDLVDALLAKVAADAGEVDGAEGDDAAAPTNDPEGDADFEIGEDDFEVGEVGEGDDDMDDEFDADADAVFEAGEDEDEE